MNPLSVTNSSPAAWNAPLASRYASFSLPPAFRIVRQVLIETVRNPSRQTISATKRERNRQLRAMAEVESTDATRRPSDRSSTIKTRGSEMQSIEDRLRVRGNAPGGLHKALPTASKTSAR